ncbi:peptide/nickel transport system substrate-binding protein [Pseudonocardia ammonioxydans]|uniref:Peptide/nickel transport system substrate-binding protein n=1 Tax=Pseudonocardia ammonioxydans TaxID=260086 RepID=A0A1I4S7P3_PSUAM|nr:ABC transporter substrate-binding protein [Pseudonocardia ammonioxydans]SFM60515.1 peptide/nickel transport system substrate-binding protein [Pseudonocardia ammonioxydans]
MIPCRTAARLLAAVIAVLLTAGCVQTTGGGDAAGAGPLSLTVATGFSIDDLDPLENGFWGVEFGYVELLMRPERGGEPTPWVLEDLTSTGPTTWRLTLPEDVSFVNGRALDGAALAELITFQLAENASLGAALPGATAAASGPLEVTLTTSRPTPSVPAILADEAMVPMYDVAAYRAHRESGAPASELIGAGIYTGPFVVDSLDGASAELSPRGDHRDGPPALADLSIKFVPEASARIQAVQAGEADIALYPPTATAPTLQGRDDAFFVTGEPTGPTFQFVLNQHEAPFDDERVRRAVYAAADYRAIAEDVMNGLYLPATGLYIESQPWAEKTQVTDVAAAGRLLDEAGWTRAGDGPRTRDGAHLRFSVLTYPQQPDSDVIALALQAQLAELGVGVDIRQVPDLDDAMEPDTGWNAAVAGNGFLSYGGDYVSPLNRYVRSDGERNHSGIADPELDALIDQVAVELDTTARDDLLRRIQHRIADRGHLAYVGLRKPGVITAPPWRGYEIVGSNLWVAHDTAPTG